MRYRVESNVTRYPKSQWFNHVPENLCANLNMAAYHAGRGGEYGVYNDEGERIP